MIMMIIMMIIMMMIIIIMLIVDCIHPSNHPYQAAILTYKVTNLSAAKYA